MPGLLEKAQSAAARARRRWLRTTHDAYRSVFGTEEGQIVLADMFQRATVPYPTLEVPGDPNATLRNVGRRELVKEIAAFAGMSESDLEEKLAALQRREGHHGEFEIDQDENDGE